MKHSTAVCIALVAYRLNDTREGFFRVDVFVALVFTKHYVLILACACDLSFHFMLVI